MRIRLGIPYAMTAVATMVVQVAGIAATLGLWALAPVLATGLGAMTVISMMTRSRLSQFTDAKKALWEAEEKRQHSEMLRTR